MYETSGMTATQSCQEFGIYENTPYILNQPNDGKAEDVESPEIIPHMWQRTDAARVKFKMKIPEREQTQQVKNCPSVVTPVPGRPGHKQRKH